MKIELSKKAKMRHTNKCKNGRKDKQRNDMGGNETYTHTYKQCKNGRTYKQRNDTGGNETYTHTYKQM